MIFVETAAAVVGVLVADRVVLPARRPRCGPIESESNWTTAGLLQRWPAICMRRGLASASPAFPADLTRISTIAFYYHRCVRDRALLLSRFLFINSPFTPSRVLEY